MRTIKINTRIFEWFQQTQLHWLAKIFTFRRNDIYFGTVVTVSAFIQCNSWNFQMNIKMKFDKHFLAHGIRRDLPYLCDFFRNLWFSVKKVFYVRHLDTLQMKIGQLEEDSRFKCGMFEMRCVNVYCFMERKKSLAPCKNHMM